MLFGVVVLTALALGALIRHAAAQVAARRERLFAGRRKAPAHAAIHSQPKPEWVAREVIRLKALMPEDGCRTIAAVFNRRFDEARGMTVGKTFVSDVIRRNHYAIQVARRHIKHAKPRTVPLNHVWGVDLTGKAESSGTAHMMLGVIDHGTRACLALHRLANRSSLGILRELISLMRRFGVPRSIRTDNEGVFRSWLFRAMLALLGIRHQRTDLHCPWQNGRIERLFGTLKNKLDRWAVASGDELSVASAQFRFWYNHVRPHQHLGGRTPAEAWSGSTSERCAPLWFEAWDGLLCGDYYAPS